jgi:hypothetical protein
MITEDRSSSRTAATTTTRKPPAFSGVTGSGKAGKKSPWDKLNSPALAPSGLGGGNGITPNFNTPSSVTAGQESYRSRQTPAWVKTIQSALPAHGGVQRPTGFSGNGTPPAQPPAWLGGGVGGRFRPPRGPRGDDVQAPTAPDLPTDSTQPVTGGEGGDSAVENYPAPVTPGFGASVIDAYNYSQLMRSLGVGGYFDPANYKAKSGSGGGFGTSYGWGGGGGGGGGGGYQPYQQWPSDMGLFQWNYKG